VIGPAVELHIKPLEINSIDLRIADETFIETSQEDRRKKIAQKKIN